MKNYRSADEGSVVVVEEMQKHSTWDLLELFSFLTEWIVNQWQHN